MINSPLLFIGVVYTTQGPMAEFWFWKLPTTPWCRLSPETVHDRIIASLGNGVDSTEERKALAAMSDNPNPLSFLEAHPGTAGNA